MLARMATSPPESFGELIRRLREEQGLSQQELGERAGYETGAGISILRIEKQGVIPRPKRLDALAEQLGVEARILREAAAREQDGDSGTATDERPRLDRLREEESRRARLETELMRFETARERASAEFLLRLREVAGRLNEPMPQLPELAPDTASEADYRMWLAKAGIERALAVATSDETYDENFAKAVTNAAAKTLTENPGIAISAVVGAGLGAVLRVVGLPAAALGASVTPIVQAMMETSKTMKRDAAARVKQRREQFLSELERAESEVDESEPNVTALEAVLPDATRLFDDIATYGARALTRWNTNVGRAEVDWATLGPVEQENYRGLVEVAGAQLALRTISIADLATLRGPDLDNTLQVAKQVLTEANTVISTRI